MFLGFSHVISGLHGLELHSSIKGHFGYFWVLAVINKAAVIIYVEKVFVWTHMVLSSLGKYLGMQILYYRIILQMIIRVFLKLILLFILPPICTSTSCLTSLSLFGSVNLFNFMLSIFLI